MLVVRNQIKATLRQSSSTSRQLVPLFAELPSLLKFITIDPFLSDSLQPHYHKPATNPFEPFPSQTLHRNCLTAVVFLLLPQDTTDSAPPPPPAPRGMMAS